MHHVSACADRSLTSQLAADGGHPIRSSPFPPWPYLEAEEVDAATKVLQSGKLNYWTGEEGRQFEDEYAAYVGTKYAIAVANGSVGLELALYALGVGPSDEVITTSRSFIASASCVATRGAKPVFADVNRDSQNVDAETLRRAITPQTKALIAVHLAGWPCDMDPILDLAHEYGLKVIEDCAQAHGARYKGRPVGSMGDISSFSFCQDKILTTGGEGGMVTTSNEELWERAWSFKDHGKSYDAVYRRQHGPGFRWLHENFGTNWRLTEMQSAIGRVLLRKLDDQVTTRRRHAAHLDAALSEIPALRTTVPPVEVYHSYYKYYVFLRPEFLRPEWSRERIVDAIVAEGVPCSSGICSEIYLEKAFENIRPEERLPVARELGETSLMMLVHPTLSDTDLDDEIAAIRKVMEHASV